MARSAAGSGAAAVSVLALSMSPAPWPIIMLVGLTTGLGQIVVALAPAVLSHLRAGEHDRRADARLRSLIRLTAQGRPVPAEVFRACAATITHDTDTWSCGMAAADPRRSRTTSP